MENYLPWVGVLSLVLFFLALDLGIFNRVPHKISKKEAFVMSCVWISLALLFNGYVWVSRGGEAALAFFTGYLLEKMLSLDNMLIFLAVFSFFSIPLRHQHRILFWGILGAIIFRMFFILVGVKLIEAFDWVLYIFGVLLIYSSYKMYKDRNNSTKFEDSKVLRWLQKWLPLKTDSQDGAFFSKEKGQWVPTPLFLSLVIIEIMDVVFAVDSIPAIFAITLDPFIVFTSNIFAILGLRSLYFLLANFILKFYYLQQGLSVILGFIGVKLFLANHIHVPIILSLGFISMVLLVTIIASIWRNR